MDGLKILRKCVAPDIFERNSLCIVDQQNGVALGKLFVMLIVINVAADKFTFCTDKVVFRRLIVRDYVGNLSCPQGRFTALIQNLLSGAVYVAFVRRLRNVFDTSHREVKSELKCSNAKLNKKLWMMPFTRDLIG